MGEACPIGIPQRDKKAFSYLTVVAKNYFYHVSRRQIKESTLHHIRLEAERHWERANEYSTDRNNSYRTFPHTLFEIDGKKIFKEYLHATPEAREKNYF